MIRILTEFLHARVVAFVFVLSGLIPLPAFAQVSTGSLVGAVADASGQVVPGAQVTIRNVDRNTATSVVTESNGAYNALFLVPGTYEVQVVL